MIKVEGIKRVDVLDEMKYMVNDYLLKQGALCALQKELERPYIDYSYVMEKVNSIRRTMDGLEHDLKILAEDL